MSMETWKPRRFVEEFQKRAGLLIDGKPGPQTQIALELVPELPPGRLYPAVPEMPEHLRTTPTPIDPADIRPGDVVERRRLYVVKGRGPDHGIDARCHDTNTHEILNPAVGTWHLVHRPDPDAEAVEALGEAMRKTASQAFRIGGDSGEPVPDLLAALRDQGWDVTRRQS